jgi:putative ABC transport system permease protein
MLLQARLDAAAADLRFALQTMRRAPLFTLVAASTLALGIGANGAMFALADSALLRPLPFKDADRLVVVNEYGPQQAGRSRIELLNFHEWTRQVRSFEAMAAAWLPAGDGGGTLSDASGVSETVATQTVTPQFFDVLGVHPVAGRTFRQTDDAPDPRVVVLSEGFWRRRFGADPTLVGRAITLNEKPLTVIGIMPAAFEFVRPASAWVLLPLPAATAEGATRGQCGVCRVLQVVGRTRPGVSAEAARAEIASLANALAASTGGLSPRRVVLTPLRDVVIGQELRITSLLFLGVVGFVLLLCCANVANLVLARATVRQRELAVRAALGAGRVRIASQLVIESLVLALIGGALGLGLAAAILRVAPALLPAGLVPGNLTLALDARVLAFSVLVAVASGVVIGLVPAWQASGLSLTQTIGDRSQITRGGGRLRAGFVVAEVAVAVVVLCVAGLLLRTLLIVDGFDPGYRANPAAVLTVRVDVPSLVAGSRYPTAEGLVMLLQRIERAVASVPGVASAGWATTLPLGGSQLGLQAFEIVGEPVASGAARPQADYQIVSPAYLRTIDLPLVAGRAFTEEDAAASPPVAIVSEAFAARHLRGRNPLGAQIVIAAGITGHVTRTIVGVARQVKGRPDETEALVQMYVPITQAPWSGTNLVVRSATGDPTALTSAIRDAVARIDPGLPLNTVMTLEDVAGVATHRHRFRAWLLMAFAALALALAMIGVFGVLAYSTQQRVREFGVRLALGATGANVLALVLGSASRMVMAGTVIGLAVAASLSGSLTAFLFGVQPLDATTFVSVALVIAGAGIGASMVPAVRAARIDPARVFRD